MTEIDYDEGVQRTLSRIYFGSDIKTAILVENLKSFVEMGHALDIIKKSLFYGQSDGRKKVLEASTFTDIIHGVLGLATEAAELAEILLGSLTEEGQTWDAEHTIEELGDIEYYGSVLRTAIGTSQEEVQRLNLEKLQKRYGDRFSREKALQRDLEVEATVFQKSLPE